MTNGYYVVMAQVSYPGEKVLTYEEYTGKRWPLDQDLEAQEELWDARHDGEVEDAYLKEVIL